jgi:hypothetical protein
MEGFGDLMFDNLRYYICSLIEPRDNINPTRYYNVSDIESSLPHKIGGENCNCCGNCEKLRSNFIINQVFSEKDGELFFSSCDEIQRSFLPFMTHIDLATYIMILLNVLKGNGPPEDLDYKDPE